MSKLVLLSLIFATIAVPAYAARDKSPKKGLRRMITMTLIFNAFYAFALTFLYGRI